MLRHSSKLSQLSFRHPISNDLFSTQVIVPIHVATGRKRGDFRIYLTSPSGTRSTLLDNRPRDFATSGQEFFINRTK